MSDLKKRMTTKEEEKKVAGGKQSYHKLGKAEFGDFIRKHKEGKNNEIPKATPIEPEILPATPMVIPPRPLEFPK